VGGQGYWLLAPFLLIFLVFYYPVIRAEELELLQGHGERFQNYARAVPLFIPSWRSAGAGGSNFDWARVVRNREHRTLLGLLFAELILVAKLLVETFQFA
jgi:hypothetical protein